MYRRTFDAKVMVAGSPQRVTANLNPRTSEYGPSHRFCYSAVHALTVAGVSLSFQAKTEAALDVARTETLGYHDRPAT